jgi:uncharacterized protein (TIGR02466 family)
MSNYELAMVGDEIYPLFPTVVYKRHMDREFTADEIELTETILTDLRGNTFNRSSQDAQVLERPAYANLKSFVIETVEKYAYEIMRYNRQVKFRITQSWLNLSLENQGHHLHHHPNSFLSGVLYLKCRKEDTITFQNFLPKTLEPEVDEYNILNSDTNNINVQSKDIVVFPSTTNHKVEILNTQTPRISLAFNVFPYGMIGTDNTLSELTL